MIPVLNRAELILIRDLRRQAEIRDALAGVGIDCTVKVSHCGGQKSTAVGNVTPIAYEYRIYVRRKNLEPARRIPAGLNR